MLQREEWPLQRVRLTKKNDHRKHGLCAGRPQRPWRDTSRQSLSHMRFEEGCSYRDLHYTCGLLQEGLYKDSFIGRLHFGEACNAERCLCLLLGAKGKVGSSTTPSMWNLGDLPLAAMRFDRDHDSELGHQERPWSWSPSAKYSVCSRDWVSQWTSVRTKNALSIRLLTRRDLPGS